MKISASTGPSSQITFKTSEKKNKDQCYAWWNAGSQRGRAEELLATASYLKTSQNYRYKQAAMYARLYGNQSLFSFMGASANVMDQMRGLPADRPTFNLVQSCVDTLLAKISQSRPTPVFLTDNSNYRQRKLAKQLNNFVAGEFHSIKAYDLASMALRDAMVEGSGLVKVFRTPDDKVGAERVLLTELLVDPNEAIYGKPRQMYQLKLVDRAVLKAAMPSGTATKIDVAERATLDNSSESSKTVSDLVLVVEGWHLPSGKNAKDGRHTIACSSGVLLDEEYTKDSYPFVFLHYSPRLLGFWSQGVAEQLMGTQMEVNSLLFTISRAIKLVGVPRVFVEEGSKVNTAHFTNDIGHIVKFQGTKPVYEVAPCVPQELYAQLQRLITYGYQQCGVSSLDAGAQKPAGLNSGEAIRTYDDIANDRAAVLSRRYDNFFIDLAYLVVDTAAEIADETGEYRTVYPAKNGTREIDLPEAKILKDNPYIIQCFNTSSLPRDPAGRMAKVTEMIQAGMISIKEGRRLLDYPDLDQMELLENAGEERVFQALDSIVEDGEWVSPDPFMPLDLAAKYAVAYYNLYAASKLEEDRCQMLRDFFDNVQFIIQEASQAAAPPPQPGQGAMQGPPNPPQASPEGLPSSPLVPNAVGAV